MPSPTAITPSQLSRLIGTPGAPVLVEVYLSGPTPGEDLRLIPGSFRVQLDRLDDLPSEFVDRKVVVVCPDGKALSQGAAAKLRAMCVPAETLEGGKAAWIAAGEPTVATGKIPDALNGTRSVWVTRHRPKIDRIACPWLIRRFVDPRAEFLFVPPADVLSVADQFGAQPFDIEDVFWSHRGPLCTFDVMLEEFTLQPVALMRVADIVRGADTNRHDLAPQAAGLLALSLGLSRMFRDDIEQLESGMLLYDALYRWARDAVDEGHDWPSAAVRQ